jgi:hypothetical protein
MIVRAEYSDPQKRIIPRAEFPWERKLEVTVPAVAVRDTYAGGPHTWLPRVVSDLAQRSRPGPGRNQENTPPRDRARCPTTPPEPEEGLGS